MLNTIFIWVVIVVVWFLYSPGLACISFSCLVLAASVSTTYFPRTFLKSVKFSFCKWCAVVPVPFPFGVSDVTPKSLATLTWVPAVVTLKTSMWVLLKIRVLDW